MIDSLARMLGLSRTDAEASMHSDRAARHVLSRRSAIGLGAAMATGSVFSFAKPVSVVIQGWDRAAGRLGTFRAFSIYFNGRTWTVRNSSGVLMAESRIGEPTFEFEMPKEVT